MHTHDLVRMEKYSKWWARIYIRRTYVPGNPHKYSGFCSSASRYASSRQQNNQIRAAAAAAAGRCLPPTPSTSSSSAAVVEEAQAAGSSSTRAYPLAATCEEAASSLPWTPRKVTAMARRGSASSCNLSATERQEKGKQHPVRIKGVWWACVEKVKVIHTVVVDFRLISSNAMHYASSP